MKSNRKEDHPCEENDIRNCTYALLGGDYTSTNVFLQFYCRTQKLITQCQLLES